MFTLREFLGILRKALVLYEGIAEVNGQSGDIEMFDEMMLEYTLIQDLCLNLENEFIQHQIINKIQLYTLLKDKGENVYKAVNSIVEVYYNHLEYKIEEIKEEQGKLEGVKGLIEMIEP